MEKPITILYADFIKLLTETINNSGLPAFVILSALRDAERQVEKLAVSQLQRDEAMYLESIEQDMEDSNCGKQNN